MQQENAPMPARSDTGFFPPSMMPAPPYPTMGRSTAIRLPSALLTADSAIVDDCAVVDNTRPDAGGELPHTLQQVTTTLTSHRHTRMTALMTLCVHIACAGVWVRASVC